MIPQVDVNHLLVFFFFLISSSPHASSPSSCLISSSLRTMPVPMPAPSPAYTINLNLQSAQINTKNSSTRRTVQSFIFRIQGHNESAAYTFRLLPVNHQGRSNVSQELQPTWPSERNVSIVHSHSHSQRKAQREHAYSSIDTVTLTLTPSLSQQQ